MPHSFPTRRSSDLIVGIRRERPGAKFRNVALVGSNRRNVDDAVNDRPGHQSDCPVASVHTINSSGDFRQLRLSALFVLRKHVAFRLATGRAMANACAPRGFEHAAKCRSEEHTSELQSLMRISYAVFCLQ